jgi:uncharacterized DUF497 family protein
MLETVNGFDWDEGNSVKCCNRIPQEDIEYLFSQQNVDITPDYKHSEHETRYIAKGVSPTGKYMFVAFTLRQKDGDVLIRPISVRYMNDREVNKYESSVSQS